MKNSIIDKQKPTIHLGFRIPADWYESVQTICAATGQTKTEVCLEAMALYLKKASVITVRSQIKDLQEKVAKLFLLQGQ